MQYDLFTEGKQDDERIDVESDDQLAYWSRTWGVSMSELRRAITQVGTRVKDVREHLVGSFTTAGATS